MAKKQKAMPVGEMRLDDETFPVVEARITLYLTGKIRGPRHAQLSLWIQTAEFPNPLPMGPPTTTNHAEAHIPLQVRTWTELDSVTVSIDRETPYCDFMLFQGSMQEWFDVARNKWTFRHSGANRFSVTWVGKWDKESTFSVATEAAFVGAVVCVPVRSWDRAEELLGQHLERRDFRRGTRDRHGYWFLPRLSHRAASASRRAKR
jgi:hypothetical protein